VLSMLFKKLFEPVSIGKMIVKNRIAMAPIGLTELVDANGSLKERAIDFYVERAKGDVGLIITGLAKVENEIDKLSAANPLITRRALASLGELSESVHYYDTKIFIQLTAGFGRVAHPIMASARPVSASEVPNYWNPNITCRELKTEEVERLVKAFGAAVELVAAAGIDGIELHGHEGYLFDQFTTAIWNKRKDKYGGELRERLTFPIEVIKEIKERVGKNFPVQYRFGLKHYMKGPWSSALPGEEYKEMGRDIEEGLEMAKLLEKAGVDALHVDAGCYDSWYWAHPPAYQSHGCMVDMAAYVKRIVGIPVIAVGKLDLPELANKVIEEGKADIIAIGRGLLADPYWIRKVKEGRIEDIRPCIGCHDGCLGRLFEGKPVSCAVNPSAGRERSYELKPVDKPKKVLVAGGGVAGLEAARVLSLRGHQVILYEKRETLGGNLLAASVPSFKEDVKRLLEWYRLQIEKLGVKIRLKTEVTPTLVEEKSPDVVILATGSVPIMPNIPGINKPHVGSCIDFLLGRKKVRSKIVVVGGGLIGCETALWFSKQGKEVAIVELLPEILSKGVFHANRIMLIDLLALHKVKIMTSTRVSEILDDGVVLVNEKNERKVMRCDSVAIAVGLKPNTRLYEQLREKIAYLYLIGDCKEPRKIKDAVWEGYVVANSL